MVFTRTRTWLPLLRWAEIVGINPLHFAGATSSLITHEICGAGWYQYEWQAADRVGRESLARAIREAEDIISGYVGYNLIPDWQVDERHQVIPPAVPELLGSGYNLRGMRKSVKTDKGHIIAGGIQGKTLIEADAVVVRTDADGDGYKEVVTLTVTTTVTEPCEVRVFYPGESADIWEIRPIEVTISGGVATIVLRSWQILDYDQQIQIGADMIDGDVDANYLTTLDVYRVFNDRSTNVSFLWENENTLCGCGGTGCQSCQLQTQTGCLTPRGDPRQGFFAYRPANWDADDEEYDSTNWCCGREPDAMRLYYYSGWQGQHLTCSTVEMDDYWAYTVAVLAASLLDRPLCDCDNQTAWVKQWQKDFALQRSGSTDSESHQITFAMMENRFGTKMGGFHAMKRCQAEDRRIGRDVY